MNSASFEGDMKRLLLLASSAWAALIDDTLDATARGDCQHFRGEDAI